MLNRTAPSIDPWGTLLVTGLQLCFAPPPPQLLSSQISSTVKHFDEYLVWLKPIAFSITYTIENCQQLP